MPRLDITPNEYESLMALIAAGSTYIEFGTREWKQYEELRAKLKKQVEG